jgi:photosystem II stability/assembly factor-like uncharacterized protein
MVAVWVVALLAGALIAGGSGAAGAAASSPRAPRAVVGTLGELAFFNLDNGYGVFSQYGSTTCTDRIGVTDDAGARFTPLVRVAHWPCAQNAPASHLAFDDHGDGFFYGPKLFVTHDGGASWAADPQHGAVLSVEALGYSIWMLETARQPPPYSAKPHSMGLRLFESDNGGLSWSVVALPAAAVIQPFDDSNAYFTGWLTRVSQSSAYVAAQAPFHGSRELDVTPMWFTTDAGATWSDATIPCMSINSSVIMSVAPQGTAYDVCASEPGAGSQLKQVLVSSDDGAHWTYRVRCADGAGCGPNGNIGGYVSEIDAVSSTTVYEVGGRADLSVSRDGGRQWRLVPGVDPNAGASGGTTEVIFFSPHDGLVLGQGYRNGEFPTELWETADGGAHWTARFPSAA